MKQPKEIKSLIQSLIKSVNKKTMTEKEIRPILHEIKFMRGVEMYLKTEPREEYVKCEIERLEKLIESIEKKWTNYFDSNKNQLERLPKSSLTKAKDFYLKEIPFKDYQTQLKTLKFLL